MVDMAVYAAFEAVSNDWYVRSRKKYHSLTGVSVLEKDLIEDDAEDGTPPWLTQEEFLEKHHVHRTVSTYWWIRSGTIVSFSLCMGKKNKNLWHSSRWFFSSTLVQVGVDRATHSFAVCLALEEAVQSCTNATV